MSGNPWDEEEEETGQQQDGSTLRKQLEAMAKKAKAAEDKAAKLEREVAASKLSDVLSAKGLSPKLSKFILQSDVDPSDEKAVAAWLEDNEDLFGKPEPKTEAKPKDEVTDPLDVEQDDPAIELFRQLARTQRTMTPEQVGSFESTLKGLSPDATKEEVATAFKAGKF